MGLSVSDLLTIAWEGGGCEAPWGHSVSCHNSIDLALADAMGGKADDVGSLGSLAEPTSGAGDVVSDGSGTGDDGVLAHLEVGALLIGCDDGTHGQVGKVALYHGGMGEPVGGHVDGEAVSVGATNRQQVGSGEGLVSVGEATAPLVGCHKLSDGWQVDGVAFAWQVANLVVAPQLTLGQLADAGQQSVKVAATLTTGHLGPVNRQGTTKPVAAAAVLSFEGASVRAGVVAGGRDGQRSHLAVGAHGGEVVEAHRVVCVGLAHYRHSSEPPASQLVPLVKLSPRCPGGGRSPC